VPGRLLLFVVDGLSLRIAFSSSTISAAVTVFFFKMLDVPTCLLMISFFFLSRSCQTRHGGRIVDTYDPNLFSINCIRISCILHFAACDSSLFLISNADIKCFSYKTLLPRLKSVGDSLPKNLFLMDSHPIMELQPGCTVSKDVSSFYTATLPKAPNVHAKM
jgi:hypothetical protein